MEAETMQRFAEGHGIGEEEELEESEEDEEEREDVAVNNDETDDQRRERIESEYWAKQADTIQVRESSGMESDSCEMESIDESGARRCG